MWEKLKCNCRDIVESSEHWGLRACIRRTAKGPRIARTIASAAGNGHTRTLRKTSRQSRRDAVREAEPTDRQAEAARPRNRDEMQTQRPLQQVSFWSAMASIRNSGDPQDVGKLDRKSVV